MLETATNHAKQRVVRAPGAAQSCKLSAHKTNAALRLRPSLAFFAKLSLPNPCFSVGVGRIGGTNIDGLGVCTRAASGLRFFCCTKSYWPRLHAFVGTGPLFPPLPSQELFIFERRRSFFSAPQCFFVRGLMQRNRPICEGPREDGRGLSSVVTKCEVR